MANTPLLLRSTTAGNKPSALVSGQIAINEQDAIIYYRAAATGAVTALPTGSSLASYATTASFPATGATGTLYLTDASKLYRWESTVYVEVGTVAPVVSASDIATGTLDDARLSANVILGSALAARQHQTTSVIDVIDRAHVVTALSLTSGAIYWTFFTPSYSLTVSQIAIASSSSSSSITLARLGLYTADAAGNCTLVARTASDTTFLNAGNTVFTRSLDTTGGYPAAYTLAAGTRYAVAFIAVGSGIASVQAASTTNTIASVTPRMQGVRTSQSDLITSQTSGQFNASVNAAIWYRLS
jgi:hypothetical protein